MWQHLVESDGNFGDGGEKILLAPRFRTMCRVAT